MRGLFITAASIALALVVVATGVPGSIGEFDILDPIIEHVSVVDDLARSKLSTDVSFHDQSVLRNVRVADENVRIAADLDSSALPCGRAIAPAIRGVLVRHKLRSICVVPRQEMRRPGEPFLVTRYEMSAANPDLAAASALATLRTDDFLQSRRRFLRVCTPLLWRHLFVVHPRYVV